MMRVMSRAEQAMRTVYISDGQWYGVPAKGSIGVLTIYQTEALEREAQRFDEKYGKNGKNGKEKEGERG